MIDMTKGTVLFDLDGTIADSQEGIVNALEYMIEELSLPTQTKAELVTFIAPPSMKQLCVSLV